MKFGVQNSVIAWDDPWHRESCKTMMRTGEGAWFPSQDRPPEKREFLDCIKNVLGVDFYVHHVMPNDAEISELIQDLDEYGIDYILANEFGNANKFYTEGTNRYDISPELIQKAATSKHFLGLLYDETEHLQLNNLIYQKNPHLFQWGNPNGLPVDAMEENLVENVRRFVRKAGCPVYGEVLFATLYHAFNRAGMRLSAKAIKEIWQPMQFAVALGAARQYGIPLSITVDLWGPDVGNWFTRIWGFPGHSPEEFEAGLRMAYYLSPEIMFVENCDALLWHKEGFVLTPFGEVYRNFIEEYREKKLPYSANDAVAEIAVIRSEDGLFSRKGTFYGKGLYGADAPMPDEKACSFFDVMHVLSHGQLPSDGSTPYLTGHDVFPSARYPRDGKTMQTFPLEQGVQTNEPLTHTLFMPLNNVLVFDSFAGYDCLEESRLIILCGSRISEGTAKAVLRRAEEGAKVIAANWFRGQLPGWKIKFVHDFAGAEFLREAEPFIGTNTEWKIRFSDYQLRITNPSRDKISLKIDLSRRQEE